MSDTEILNGLECCSIVNPKCQKCPYRNRYEGMLCEYALRNDAIHVITVLKRRLKEIKEEKHNA